MQGDVAHRVVAWDEVALDEGTGIVHIAPGCGAEDFELGKREGLPVLTPVDDAGAFYDSYGWLHGVHTHEATERIVDHLGRERLAASSRRPTRTATRSAGAAAPSSSSASSTSGSSRPTRCASR